MKNGIDVKKLQPKEAANVIWGKYLDCMTQANVPQSNGRPPHYFNCYAL